MTTKRTGGGTFDPAERNLYFAAGTNWTGDTVRWPPYVLVATNDLLNERDERLMLVNHLDAGRNVLLDSGIFWLTNQHKRAHGCTMNEALTLPPEEIDGFAELYDRYVSIVQRYGDRLWGWIELDQGGAVNKRRTRARLEAQGIIPMPVYHPLNDGWDYFHELASGYDRICLGNIVQATRGARLRLLHTMWERHRQYPDLWVHILGLTANEWCFATRPDSCDSSTWLAPLRWPAVRTESALLRKTGDLGPRFAYDIGNPDAVGATRSDAFGLCADAVSCMTTVWQHAAERTGQITSQPSHPPYLPSERTLTP